MAKFLLGNLKGPKGDKGDPGPRGPQGIQGPPGTAENIDLTPFVKKTEGATLTGQYTFTNNTPIKLNGYNIVSENNRILFKNADNNNVFAFDANTITHNDKSLLTQDKANTLYAPIGDYALRTALNSYATKTDLNNYVTTANANTTYLSKSDAANTYATKGYVINYSTSNFITKYAADNAYAAKSDLNSYMTTANANSTYLSKTDASNAYLSKTDASTTYVAKTDLDRLTNIVDTTYVKKINLNDYVTNLRYTNDMDSLLAALRKVNN